DVASILQLVHNLIHEEKEEEEDKPSHRMQNVGEQGHMALLGHSLAAYISVLDRDRLRKLTTRILSDTTLWLCRLFRYENGSAYFHEDDREGLVKVCRLVINDRYEDYASEGYTVLSSMQPVIYQSASCRPGLGQHLCSQLGLPLSSLCTVPCNTVFGSQHQMDVALLDKLIKEDVEAGKLPLLLIANAGTPGAGHTDKLGRLKELCDQYKMWLHVEGVNLATLVLGQVSSSLMAATKSDSMTLTPGPWLGLPAVTAVTLYRHEDPALSLAAGLTSSQPVEKLRALPLWLSLQYLGHNGIVHKIRHATALCCLVSHVEDELNSPVVVFRFSQEMSAASSGGSVEGYCAGEKEVLDAFNRWLGEQLAQLVPVSGIDVVELEDEGTCVRFSPLLTAAVLGTQQKDVEALVERLSELVSVLSSTMCLRQDFREETHRHSPSLRYIEDLSWPGLGVVRYEPQSEGLDESKRKQEVQKINSELLKKLQELDTDISFSTGPDFGTEQDCIFVGMVTDDVDISELVDTITALGRDIEESGRLLENMTEVVRKGIQEAELQLQKANEEKLMEEGMLRQLPVVGSVLNWFSPVQSSIKGRTFNLAAGTVCLLDPSLYRPCAAMISASVLSFSPAFSSHWYVFSISATSAICWWYMPCRGLCLHDSPSSSSSSSSSSLGSCCLRYSFSRSSLGAIFLKYSLIFAVSSWMLALMLTSPLPPSFRIVCSLKVLDMKLNPPCIVRSFFVLISVTSTSSFGQDIIPAEYLITGRT
uniref:Pyridoxal-dependent decarboxylase domain-containing protein 1 n=1 Tax=Myripristis murdjan TaxID=586833 RepID=A0A667XGX7_9TELE